MELTFSLVLPRDALTVPVVRRLCRGALTDLGVGDECVSDIELALTEACANVIAHADTPEDEYEVVVNMNEDRCEIRVVDTGRGFDSLALLDTQMELSAERGRGIHLMRSLVDRVQFESRPEEGTIVRLEKRLEIEHDGVLRRMAAAVPTPAPDA